MVLRARIIQAIRQYFIGHAFLEVDTPVRIPAPAPEAHIDAQESGEWFLQTSPELCMKILLASDYPRIFQICKCFRQKERGDLHIPELTLLEWYCPGNTYLEVMGQCEDLIQSVALAAGFNDIIPFQNQKIELKKPWDRMSVADAFKKYAPLPVEEAISTGRFDEIVGCDIEPHLGLEKPLFLFDFPSSKAALSRLKPGSPQIAERFELYMGGIELCNAFTELNDPKEQRSRFEKEIGCRQTAGKRITPMPEKFLRTLEFMPQAAGNALGVDRLVMLFADTKKIDDVVAFTPEEL